MSPVELQRHVQAQIRNIMCVDIDCNPYMDSAIERTMRSIKASPNKYFEKMGNCPDAFNSNAYTLFLYYLSNEMYKRDGGGENAEKVYYLNKIINSFEAFYADELPEIIGCEHPLGSVMGRAKYGNHLFFYQGCTVGGNWNGDKLNYPVFGDYVTMFSNSKVLGDSLIGNHVIIGANAYVVDTDVPDYSYVFPSGDGRTPIIIESDKEKILTREKNFWKI